MFLRFVHLLHVLVDFCSAPLCEYLINSYNDE